MATISRPVLLAGVSNSGAVGATTCLEEHTYPVMATADPAEGACPPTAVMTKYAQCLSLDRPESYSSVGRAADASVHVTKFPQPMIYSPTAGLGRSLGWRNMSQPLPATAIKVTHVLQLCSTPCTLNTAPVAHLLALQCRGKSNTTASCATLLSRNLQYLAEHAASTSDVHSSWGRISALDAAKYLDPATLSFACSDL